MKTPLKIAFLTNWNAELPAWEAELLNTLKEKDFISLNNILIGNQGVRQNKSLFLRLFMKFESLWFRKLPDAFKNTTLHRDSDNFEKTDITNIQKIKELNLDVIYCSCLTAYGNELTGCSRYGIWQVEFGTGKFNQSWPWAYWEVMTDTPEIGSYITMQLPDSDKKTISYRGTTTTVPYSVKNTLNIIAWKTVSFIVYRLKELSESAPEQFKVHHEKTTSNFETQQSAQHYHSPSSLIALKNWIINISRYIRYKWKNALNKKRFTILFSKQDFSFEKLIYEQFIALTPPLKSFWADPFIVSENNIRYIFFEEYVNARGKAHICVLEIYKDGEVSAPRIILDKPYHLSYPFIFTYGDSYYMIPETSSNRTVELYKCKAFPDKWEFVMNLFEDILLIDATVFYAKGKWWLFGCSTQHAFTSTNDQLLLYYNETLLSNEWKAHPQNPVATSISNCRPAGKIFESAGKLYRPAQHNASRQYGYGIKINEITVLSETEYEETEVFDITPGKENGLAATHTINFANGFIVIDGILR